MIDCLIFAEKSLRDHSLGYTAVLMWDACERTVETDEKYIFYWKDYTYKETHCIQSCILKVISSYKMADILNITGEPIFNDRIIKIETYTYNPYANITFWT